MKKRLFSFMLSIIMMLSLSVTSFAANIDMDSDASLDSSFAIDEEFVSNKILENHGLVITPTASYHLLDTSGNPTYTCVEFTYNDSGIGYGIVDLCSYELVLYSLEKEPLFEEDDLVVYSPQFIVALYIELSFMIISAAVCTIYWKAHKTSTK